MSTILIEERYVVRRDGLVDKVVAQDARPSEEIAEQLRAAIKGFVSGKVKPLRIVHPGQIDFENMEVREIVSQKRDAKTGKLRRDLRPVPVAERHVLAAKYRGRKPDSLEETKPFIRLVLDTAAKVDLPVPRARKRSKGKGKKEEEGDAVPE